MTETKIIIFETEKEYRETFKEIYVNVRNFGFFGFPVCFIDKDFDHIFYEPAHGGGCTFSKRRAKKMFFIKSVLNDEEIEREVMFEDSTGNIAIFCKDLDCVIYLRKRDKSFQIGTFFDFGERHTKGYLAQKKKCREISKEEIEKMFGN